MLSKYETVMLYVMAVVDCIERFFVRCFPTACIMFIVLYAYGIVGSMEQDRSVDFQSIIAVAVVLTVLGLIYNLLILKNHIRNTNSRKRR